MNQHELPLDRPETPPEIQEGQLPPVFNIREVDDQVLDQYRKAVSGLNDAPAYRPEFASLIGCWVDSCPGYTFSPAGLPWAKRR